VSASEFHGAIWRELPEGVEPVAYELRRNFLLAQVRAGDRVLDLGCGEGAFAGELARAGAHVLAADVAEEPLRRVRERHPDLDVRLLAGHPPWPLPDGGFDVVWAGEVIEHVCDTAAWLSEVRRLLVSGGRLLISTPAHGRITRLHLALSERAFAEHFDPRSDHLRFYTRGMLGRLLGDFGFEQVQVRAVAGPPGARRLLLASAVRGRFATAARPGR
jgi:2-polyprenyl-3-methyl-5-hydroxy-6-metoxy-1,4-benzoquinol methylase